MGCTQASDEDTIKWVSFILFGAAIYNLLWGALAVVAPLEMLRFLGISGEYRTEFWQCIGMFVGLYGVGYWFASVNPVRYWPFVLVGLLGKVLGPAGAIVAVSQGRLPVRFIWVNVTNDFIWWVPFAWILWVVNRRKQHFAMSPPSEPNRSLYRRILGSEFDHLSPRIRAFHDATAPIEVRGTFNSRRGSSTIGNWLTNLSGFPPTSESLDVSLRVEPRSEGEQWHRTFGDFVVESSQCEAHGQLSERFGPLVMYLAPRVVSGALEVTDTRSTFLGIPLPPFLTPRVYAHGIDADGGIRVTVRITCSPFGLLVEYSGTVTLLDSSAERPPNPTR